MDLGYGSSIQIIGKVAVKAILQTAQAQERAHAGMMVPQAD
jgi:hypothetical protein